MATLDYLEYCDLLGFEPLYVAEEAAATVNVSSEAPVAVLAQSHFLAGEGSLKAKLIFLGALDEGETMGARAMEGPSGDLLEKMILAMGYKREEVFIGNILKSKDQAVEALSLSEQLEKISPKAIVALGAQAAQILLNTELNISHLRGKSWPIKMASYEGTLFPTFHPEFLLKKASHKKDVWEDLQKVMAFLANL